MDDLDRFREPAHPVIPAHTVRVVLLFDRAGAEAEDYPAPADVVDGRSDLGQQGRSAI
jgi:hypothetical protein